MTRFGIGWSTSGGGARYGGHHVYAVVSSVELGSGSGHLGGEGSGHKGAGTGRGQTKAEYWIYDSDTGSIIHTGKTNKSMSRLTEELAAEVDEVDRIIDQQIRAGRKGKFRLRRTNDRWSIYDTVEPGSDRGTRSQGKSVGQNNDPDPGAPAGWQ